MQQVQYDEEKDTLRIIYAKEIDQPIVRILTNGTILEFDHHHNLIAMNFPKFFTMLHRPPLPDGEFSLEGTQIIDTQAIFTIKMNEQLMNIKVDLAEL